jgi:hypothetical protein
MAPEEPRAAGTEDLASSDSRGRPRCRVRRAREHLESRRVLSPRRSVRVCISAQFLRDRPLAAGRGLSADHHAGGRDRRPHRVLHARELLGRLRALVPSSTTIVSPDAATPPRPCSSSWTGCSTRRSGTGSTCASSPTTHLPGVSPRSAASRSRERPAERSSTRGAIRTFSCTRCSETIPGPGTGSVTRPTGAACSRRGP